MIGALKNLHDRLLGRGAYAITVPVFDGALKPNQILQAAQAVASFAQPEDMACDGAALFVADGASVVRVTPSGGRETVLETGLPVTALACVEGGLAVALDGREVRIHGGRHDGKRYADFAGDGPRAINSIAVSGNRLIVTDGSREHDVADWRHDVMELGRTGSVHAVDLASGESERLAENLGFSFGAALRNGEVVVSESWNHRLVALAAGGRLRSVLDQLPAYPSRMAPASGGGYWLSLFCARTQLVELVLREPGYRRVMIDSVDPDLWISPQLFSYRSFHEPMQYAGVKQQGEVKPWAPPRSYGLVVRLDADFRPLMSFHSRAGGRFHGVTAVAELEGKLWFLSKGDGVLACLDLAAAERELIQ